MSNSKKSIKKRYWAFIAYPESISDTWLQDLKRSGIKAAISPLHDSDINDDGNIKKPHYHVLLAFSGPTTFNSVSSFTSELGGTIPIPIENMQGAFEYLCHLNDPDKAQYDTSDIQVINGFDIRNYIELSFEQMRELKRSIHQLVLDMNFLEYSDLMDYLLINDMELEYDFASKQTIYFNSLITSRRHKIKRN